MSDFIVSRSPLCISFAFHLQALSLETTSASTVAFICSLAVVVVPLVGLILPGENKPGAEGSGQPWYGPLLPALLAAAGVGCLELGGTEVPGMGDLLALGQPLFFGYGFYRIEHLMKVSINGSHPIDIHFNLLLSLDVNKLLFHY